MKRLAKKIVLKLRLYNIPSMFFYLFRIFRIDNKKIMIINYNGKGYGDNAKYIVEELLKRNENNKIVWLVRDYDDSLPKCIKQVKRYSLKYFYELSTAKIWINNARFRPYVRKRKNQIYFQVWHGSIPLKKIEHDNYNEMPDYYKTWMNNDTNMTDYMISGSEFFTNIIKRGFKYDGKILEVGTPKNDIYFRNMISYSKKIKYKYSIKEDEKIVMYAPTFRQNYNNNTYNLDLTHLSKKLQEIDNNNWKVLVRFHPNVPKAIITKYFSNNSNAINVTNYPDMQELICACDMIISDYSSIMFEGMIAEKPVLLYMNDIKDYQNERDLYFDNKELPFPIINDNNKIEKLINEDLLIDIQKKYTSFKNKIGFYENGKSSKAIADIILEIIGDKDE